MSLDSIEIQGGFALQGEVSISGAKNGALPAMAATLLTQEPCSLKNIPDLQDVQSMMHILKFLGSSIDFKNSEMTFSCPSILQSEAPYDFVRKMRASVLLLGPLLARQGIAKISLPGGCAIGVRPIDLHLKAMEALGAEIELQDGYVVAKAAKLKGGVFEFETVTVTGTINALMAASRAEGESTFKNCAAEPEVVYCGKLLEKMGVKIEGLGTRTIKIKGEKVLKGFHDTMLPDRIETGTYMIAAAITEGDLVIQRAAPEHLEALIQSLQRTGVTIKTLDSSTLQVSGRRPYKPVSIITEPHPGFPTDMQAQFMTFLCLADGQSRISETIFENRFMHVPELVRMGAKIKIKGSLAKIDGVKELNAAPVMATDLRASASLVLAGLVAKGTTKVSRIYHLDRGYEKMEVKLRSVGAKIVRVSSKKSDETPET